jgi:[protein-PII] uridylyltransferase
MYPMQSTAVESGLAMAEPLVGSRLGSKARSWHGFLDAAPPAESLRHVLRAIASDPNQALDRERWLARARPIVNRSHATLRASFEADGSVEAFLRGRARLADGAVIGLLHLARAVVTSDEVVTAIAPLTVLAVGGYGRRELAPASDLDLLFLLGDSAGRAHAERLIGFVLTGLWDLGFEVGHASRTAAESMEFARADHVALASLLDARFLAGSFGVHAMHQGNIRQTAKEIGGTAVAAALAPTLSALRGPIANDEEEPNVKRGLGALRDIQGLLWLGRLAHVGADFGALRELVGPDATVLPVVADAHRFLWQVRCHLHLLAGRAQDRLVRELQPLVARRLGLGRGPDTGVAELMARYHAHTRSVRALLTAPYAATSEDTRPASSVDLACRRPAAERR